MSIPFFCYADIETDRAMAKIIRDSQTYLSADAREGSEEAAYEKAATELVDAINNYLNEIQKPEKKISGISGLPGLCNQLTSKISDSRYRVLLYVKKSDFADQPKPQPAQKATTATPSPSNAAPANPTLSKISKLQTKSEVVETIKALHKSQQLTGGASFPVGHANDFYVVVINGDKVAATLHFKDGQYIDIEDSKVIDINKYSNCTGYWFTLPNTK